MNSAQAGIIPFGFIKKKILLKTFNYTGAAQTFTVPAGCTSINVTAVGGGGASGTWGGGGGSTGGAGGYVKANVSVSPGATYTVIVGRGGQASSWGGGGGGHSVPLFC